MIDDRRVLLHSVEMAEHANGTAQYLEAIFGDEYVMREQV